MKIDFLIIGLAKMAIVFAETHPRMRSMSAQGQYCLFWLFETQQSYFFFN